MHCNCILITVDAALESLSSVIAVNRAMRETKSVFVSPGDPRWFGGTARLHLSKVEAEIEAHELRLLEQTNE